MQLKNPKNEGKFYWTEHSLFKMKYYRLSAQKILGIIRKPFKKERGIVKKTVAVMQPVNPKIITKGRKIWKQEIWAMYQERNKKSRDHKKREGLVVNKNWPPGQKQIVIISAWRYPGMSPKNNPIPEEILTEIQEKFYSQEKR
jgi:hypothetical protein